MKRYLIVAAVAVLVLGGSVALALPDGDGTIDACVKGDGQVRIVDSSDDCKNNETHMRWNEEGLPGEDGAQGPAGPQGPQGEQGIQGEPGLRGATGVQGELGPKGDTGDQGATGATGEQGPKGDKGDKGEQGPQGEQGQPGEDGADGNLLLAGQTCAEAGAAVVGFDANGNIICQVLGTTTTTQPANNWDLSGDWIVTNRFFEGSPGCYDFGPAYGAAVTVQHDLGTGNFEISWESVDGPVPVQAVGWMLTEDDQVSEVPVEISPGNGVFFIDQSAFVSFSRTVDSVEYLGLIADVVTPSCGTIFHFQSERQT
jgi:hypothetical protein